MSNFYAEDLFRKQAIDALSQRPLGRPICIMPRPWSWLVALIAAIFVVALLFLSTAEFSRKETVRGWLVSKEGVVRIAHDAAARVTSVVHKPGDKVRKGEPLLFMSTDSTLASGVNKNEHLLEKIRDEISETEAQSNLLHQQLELDLASVGKQLRNIDVEGQSLSAQWREQRRVVEFGLQKLNRLRKAANGGAVSEWDLLQQQSELATLRQELGRLERDTATLQRERELLQSRSGSLPVQAEIRLSDLRLQKTRLLQQVAEYESRRLTVLKSPLDGTIAVLVVRAGNTVAPQQLLMTILPADMSLLAEVYVPSSAMGFVRRGQVVRLAYDALPRQKFGTFAGIVNHVSEFVLLPAEIPQTFPVREATYKVQVRILDEVIETSIGSTRLRPGMLLAAEIVMERRNLLDWLLEPLHIRRSGST